MDIDDGGSKSQGIGPGACVVINIMTAHKPEAKGMIRAYRLERDFRFPAHRIYTNDREGERGVRLCITGTGYQRCQDMTRFIQSVDAKTGNEQPCIWINFGIAGSGNFPVGKVVIGESVLYLSTGEIWYFPAPDRLNPSIPVAKICTVDKPEEVYPEPYVYDMEAAGMLSVIDRLVVPGRAIIVKIVSDGPEKSLQSFNYRQVEQLLENNMHNVVKIINVFADKCLIEHQEMTCALI